MTLYLFSEPSLRPQIFDQHFDPDELLSTLSFQPIHRHPLMRSSSCVRPWRVQNKDTGSSICCDKNKFQVNLDVQQFSPEELTVKAIDNSIVVEGKHEEKPDEHGYISRQFKRRYILPEGHDINKIETKLSTDGVLTITAPKMEAAGNEEKMISITQTGQPHKPIQSEEEPKE